MRLLAILIFASPLMALDLGSVGEIAKTDVKAAVSAAADQAAGAAIDALIATRDKFINEGQPQRPDYASAENDEARQEMYEKFMALYEKYQGQLKKYNMDILGKIQEFMAKYPASEKVASYLPQAIDVLANVGDDKEMATEFAPFYESILKNDKLDVEQAENALFFRGWQVVNAISNEELPEKEREALAAEELKKYCADLAVLSPRFKDASSFGGNALQVANVLANYNPELTQKALDACKKLGGPEAQKEAESFSKDIAAKAALMETPLELELTALDGKTFKLSDYRGKVVLLDFWATWCGPCVGEVPHMLEVYEKYHKQGFEIVGISLDNDKDVLVSFLKDKGITWPQSYDGLGWETKYVKQFKINGIPTMWLIGKDGKVADQDGRTDLENKIAKLLK
jgi:thiol-disulfide isomerase/thioredoxin